LVLTRPTSTTTSSRRVSDYCSRLVIEVQHNLNAMTDDHVMFSLVVTIEGKNDTA